MSAASSSVLRSQRRPSMRQMRKALMPALLAPLVLAGPINPATAAIMRYTFKGDFSKTETGFNWLSGAKLKGYMDWDIETSRFTDWSVRGYLTPSQLEEERTANPGKLTQSEIRSQFSENQRILASSDLTESKQSELQAQNDSLLNAYFNPARTRRLMDISSSAPGSYCFTSPLGLSPASEGGTYSQGPADTDTCNGTNGIYKEKLPVGTGTPRYFSVIQYSKDDFSGMEANFAFRLAFLPTDTEGVQQVVGYSDKPNADGLYESQPWYGAGFRFGGSQAGLDVNGDARCSGSPATAEELFNTGQWVTAACPFAPDRDGLVAGQTFLSSLELTAEKIKDPALKSKPPGFDDDEDECDEGGEGGENGDKYKNSGSGGEGGEGGESGHNCKAQTPAPLPIAGAGAAFAWSRRVRRRYTLVPAKAQIVA